MDTQKQVEQIHERMQLMFPTEENKIDAVMTAMGVSAILTKYIHEVVMPIIKIEFVPTSVLYAMAVTSANMCALTAFSHDADFQMKKFPLLGSLTDEQFEETMRQKMIEVVTYLYNYIKGDENV